jgi:hypothetical protein
MTSGAGRVMCFIYRGRGTRRTPAGPLLPASGGGYGVGQSPRPFGLATRAPRASAKFSMRVSIPAQSLWRPSCFECVRSSRADTPSVSHRPQRFSHVLKAPCRSAPGGDALPIQFAGNMPCRVARRLQLPDARQDALLRRILTKRGEGEVV